MVIEAALLDLATVGSFRVQPRIRNFLRTHLMISFQVNDMTCGHCVSAITKSLKAEDDAAQVRFDLASHRVDIESAVANAAGLSEAIKAAGYTPVQIDVVGCDKDPSAATAHQRCCCSQR